MSRFPKLSETFVLYEIVALRELGYQVSVYPLIREHEQIVHDEVDSLRSYVHYLPWVSRNVLVAQARHLWRHPRQYLSTLATLVRSNLGSWNYLFGGLAMFPKVVYMAELLAARGVDHIHCHFSSHPATAGYILHRLSRITFSFTAHGSDLHVDRHMLCEKVQEASFVIAISEYNRRLIIEHCGEAASTKTSVIHSGVDTSVFIPRPTRIPGSSDFRIACIGRLTEVKGQKYLVQALRLLCDEGVAVTCQLVGDGPDRAALEKYVKRLELSDQISFMGNMTRGQIAQLLHGTDVLVAPSVPTRDGRREGIPIVLMEAMATGLPVIASRLSGIPELVEDGVEGLLVPAGDARALAEAIRRLQGDPDLRHSLGTAARRKVETEFDVRQTARRLASCIPKTVGASPHE